jgi:hypothetical protein
MCPTCRGHISNGLTEWSNLDWFDKTIEWTLRVFQIVIIGPVFFTAIGIVVCLLLDTFSPFVIVPFSVLGFALPAYVFWRDVAESKLRVDKSKALNQ